MVKFLVIRFSSIGEIVLTTPVIRCMKEQIEDVEIHYLTKTKYKSILIANPYIDKLHLLDKNIKSLIDTLKKEKFDYIIDLHKNLRSFRIKSSLKRFSFSFNKLNYQKWLLVNFKINKLPNVHIVDRYLKTLEVFSVSNDHKGLDYFIPPEEITELSASISEFPRSYIVLVVGGGHYTKQIPVHKIQEIINSLDCPIMLLGGPEDVAKANQLKISEKKKIYNLVGKLSVNQSAEVIRNSSLVVSVDTGLMHIAAAFNKKIVSVWGNTVPEFGMYPYNSGENSNIFEVKGLKCRPCSKIGFKKCPKKHFNCMILQDYQAIIKTIDSSVKN